MMTPVHRTRDEGVLLPSVPVFQIEGRCLADVWEQSVLRLWDDGIDMPTEYDRPGDPPSRDCTMIQVVPQPLAEPRIHRAFPARLEDLEIYRQEIVDGIHDDRVDHGGWPYSYHRRLYDYRQQLDQMEQLIDRMIRAPYTRRAQAITWIPETDTASEEPPCLQRLHVRAIPDNENLTLQFTTHWRSRDAFKAAFMNMWALTALQQKVAVQLSRATGQQIEVGPYVDISDSYHIYGKDREECRRFVRSVHERSFEDRTWTTDFARDFFDRAKALCVNGSETPDHRIISVEGGRE